VVTLAVPESTEQKEAEEEILKWPLPFNISIDKLDVIVKAFFQGQADTRSVSSSEISRTTGIHDRTLKPNIKFLQALKILKTGEGTDSYTFEPKGKEYAQNLATNNMPQTASILKGLLSDNLKELVTFVELKKSTGELNFESLFTHIKAMARLKDDPKYPRGVAAPYSAGITTVISLLTRAGITPADILTTRETPKGAVKKVKIPVQTKLVEPAPLPVAARVEQKIEGQTTNLPLTININVEAKDPESIRELINLLKELRQQTSG
jgi:hypothetical protein